MSVELSQEDYDRMFGGGLRATPEPVGLGGLFGSAVDRTQASLYGVGEALGLPLEQQRWSNQAEADATAQRYYQETGRPRSFSEASSLGDYKDLAVDLGVQSAPWMAGVAAGGLVGGMPGALAVGSTFGVGDVLDSQREQSGDTNIAAAIPLGLAYGAMDTGLGIGGVLARRSAGTGIRALDRAGTNYLDNLSGVPGAAARTAATGLKTTAVEATTETGQEAMNQLGRMAVDPSASLTDPDAMERYKESFLGGGLLGGVFGAGLGGWRRSQNYLPPGETLDDNRPADLLNPGAPRTETTTAPAPASGPVEDGSLPPAATVDGAIADQLGLSDITDPAAVSEAAPGAQVPATPPPVRATADIADHTMRRYGGVEPVSADNPDGPHTFGGTVYNDRELAYGALRAKAEADMQRVGETATAAKADPNVVHLAEGAYGAAFRVGEESKAASRKKYTPKAPDFASPFFQSLIAHATTPKALLDNINARIAALKGKTKVADQEQRVLLQRMANVMQTPSHDNYMQGINNGLNGAPAPKPAERPKTTEETSITHTIDTLQQFLNCMTGK